MPYVCEENSEHNHFRVSAVVTLDKGGTVIDWVSDGYSLITCLDCEEEGTLDITAHWED